MGINIVKTIQVVLDAKLLNAADLAAKRQKVNRSELIRSALQEHLKRLQNQEREERDRRGYLTMPQPPAEFLPWVKTAVWTED